MTGKLEEDIQNQISEIACKGQTPIVLFDKKHILNVYALGDSVKPSSVEAIDQLHKLGITTYMLTGDHTDTAHAIANLVGIDTVIAEVKPDQKADFVKRIKAEVGQDHIVVMVGDGINDSPALAFADVGIAMSDGTDVAIETADVTLLQGDLMKILKAIKISKFTISGIRQNLTWAFSYNIIGIPLAAGAFYPIFGWILNPAFAGAAMAFSSLAVVGNSLRLQAKKIDMSSHRKRRMSKQLRIALAMVLVALAVIRGGVRGGVFNKNI